MADIRLQVVLARAGFGSRRACEELIRDGVVRVNGHLITALGTKVDEAADSVTVRGKAVRRAQDPRYVALNKPREVVSTVTDPQGRRTVMDLVKWVRERVYPVGRLDYHSEGLLLMTNDGELTEKLTHPRHGVEKVYLAKIRGALDASERDQLARGVVLGGRRTGPIAVRAVRRSAKAVPHRRPTPTEAESGASWVEVRVTEGRYHLVREALLRVGHPVSRLRRVAFGPVLLGKLQPGESRELTDGEVEALRRAATAGAPVATGGRPRPGRKAPRKPAGKPAGKAAGKAAGKPDGPPSRRAPGKGPRASGTAGAVRPRRGSE